MDGEELSRLKQKFEAFWQEIRSAELYAGQPRSRQSAACVALAREALRLATSAADDELLLDAYRMMYYTLIANEDYLEAIPFCERAIAKCEARGEHTMASRIRIGYVAALTHAGQYEKALGVALEAEQLMKRDGDEVGFARLCTNVANIYQRLDLHARANEYYETSAEVFRKIGDRKAEAEIHLNLGYVLGQMNRFEEADESYERAEAMSNELKLPELWAQATYNRAYLHYLRGRYSEALQSFARMRQHFQGSGSLRHYALCDLDEAEIYLQLNLSTDAATLAKKASEQFTGMGMAYEAAKAQTYFGIALTQMRRFAEALEVFKAAQKIFEKEGNEYFVAVLDLHRSDAHLSLQRYWEAHSLALQAKTRFESLGNPARRVASLILLGRIAMALNDLPAADGHTREIFGIIEQTNLPLMLFPCYVLRAQISERQRDFKEAERLFELAAEDLEVHHSRLQHDDLRVTFLQGKNLVYEALVRLTLGDGKIATAYAWCERAKSRGLIELLSHHLPSIQTQSERSLLGRINRLREELNFQYTKSQPERNSAPSQDNYQEVAIKEQELARSLREIASVDPQYASLQQVSIAELNAVQQFIPARSTMIEYFSTRDEIMAFVIKRDGAKVVRRLAPASRIMAMQEKLAFQLEKFLLGPDYVQTHAHHILEATNHHLKSLYQLLIEPLLPDLKTPHLAIIPHGSLHFVPFHALFDGTQYLIDRFEVSYCPSASVLKYCLEREDISGADPLILGVPDEAAPMVEDEVRRLKKVFPDAQVLQGKKATREAFSSAATRTSFLHVATHASFRQDNPMFSSFKLADGYVTALDLFSLTCETNLVTLSGCKSGLSRVSGSDDLLGLMRAFLYAGARSLMLSLWNVSDESTVALMTRFYTEWQAGLTKPQALQKAMQTVREDYPNPFYWAPFILIGKV